MAYFLGYLFNTGIENKNKIRKKLVFPLLMELKGYIHPSFTPVCPYSVLGGSTGAYPSYLQLKIRGTPCTSHCDVCMS